MGEDWTDEAALTTTTGRGSDCRRLSTVSRGGGGGGGGAADDEVMAVVVAVVWARTSEGAGPSLVMRREGTEDGVRGSGGRGVTLFPFPFPGGFPPPFPPPPLLCTCVDSSSN
jgi:hypothetical protein